MVSGAGLPKMELVFDPGFFIAF